MTTESLKSLFKNLQFQMAVYEMLPTSENEKLVPESRQSFHLFFEKRLKITLFVSLITVLAWIVYKKPINIAVFEGRSQLLAANRTFNLLFWSHFFDHHDWYAELDGTVGVESLKSVSCPVTNCYFTHDRNYVDDLSLFDAILFHGPEWSNDTERKEISRNPNQLFIYVGLEAPTKTWDNLTRYDNFYNLTMTYRFDSDVPWFYGKILDAKTNKSMAPAVNPNWLEPDEDFYDEKLIKLFMNKTRTIAWFVSNCNADSKRQNLVNKMKEYIDVDIYGGCGDSKCYGNECDDLLTYTYKFYLSFENSLCKDYVSEKLYRSLYKYSIPIVFNGAKNMNYFAPPKSMINAQDFDTVVELANYLHFLMENPREYIKYFWWKRYYKAKEHPVFRYTFCDLCMKMNDQEFMSQKHIYKSINSWVRDNMCNQTAKIEF